MFATIAFGLLAGTLVVQIVYLFKDVTKPDPVSKFTYPLVSILLLITIIIRSIKIEFPAVTNTFEALLFFSLATIVVALIYLLKSKDKPLPFVIFGATIVGLFLLALASSPLAPSAVRPPVPALQSFWLVLHVVCAFIGEAFFAFAFVTSLYYLTTKDDEKKEKLDKLTYKAIAVGYPIYILGALVFGAIWAQYSWGRYWGWDPKETWALITFLVYTIYLHVRLFKKWKGKSAAWLSVIGFIATLFTFLGVNFLLSGLHSYK